MIRSDLFYAAFERGFRSCATSPFVTRRRGKIPKYLAVVGDDQLSFWFKVNPKASAIPHQAGEFWPVIESKTLRYDERDDGLLSWYQYTDPETLAAMKRIQWSVYGKAENQTHFEHETWRQALKASLPLMRGFIEHEFQPGWPHTALYYLDETDAEAWGKLFSKQLPPWVQHFSAAPETLEGYMWRVYWGSSSGGLSGKPSSA
jgi:hypothetical protein